jgi:hypothetical protein
MKPRSPPAGLGTLVTGPNGEFRLEFDDGNLHPADAKRKRPNVAVLAFLGS